MQSYVTVKNHAEYEFEEKKSVFIADVFPVSTEVDALVYIDGIRKKYPDAKHHVYAYVLRENSIMRFTDDHEPQGTAGMPVLDVIRKNGCTDTLIVVTRYFGGTLLGTGGLVRAYTAAALGGLKQAQIITYDVYTTIEITVSYSDYQKISSGFDMFGFLVSSVDYSNEVKITGSLLSSRFSEIQDAVVQTTAARAQIKVIEEKYDFR